MLRGTQIMNLLLLAEYETHGGIAPNWNFKFCSGCAPVPAPNLCSIL